ncbi:MAG: PAS domain-containing protein [Desulfuromonadaceae bacterium]|nr:PAS domain-containing protein [Desulfuromonadaceae bacterium]
MATTRLKIFAKTVSVFLAGSAVLSFLSFFQKLLLDYPSKLIGYVVPVLAGGLSAIFIYDLLRRVQEQESVHQPDSSATAPQQFRGKPFLFCSFLGGALLLSVFSTLQKILAGYPLHPKGFIVPALFGGASGLLIGFYLMRNYQLLYTQAQTLNCLKQQNDKIADILASISDGLLVTDHSGQIEIINHAASQLLGLDADCLYGHTPEAVLNQASNTEVENFFSPQQIGAASKNFNILTPDGQPRTLSAKTTPLRNTNQSAIAGMAYLVLLHDTTEAHRIDRMKSEFISIATHNLKTPITAIAGYSELLLAQEELPLPQQKELLHYIHDKAWQMDHLIDSMLDINRVESGRELRLEKEIQPVALLIEKTQKLCHTITTHCTFQIDMQDEKTPLFMDLPKMEQAMNNLLTNAVKFSPEGEYIFISGRRIGLRYEIAIRDEGIGMTEEESSRVFDKFYRAETVAQKTPGVGLGMSVVKKIIEAHGGEIQVNSQPQQGTTVTFSLPVRESD